ncbi:MAG: hypothetical protein ABSC03_13400 [Verrucomicrobiota bacterium]|jgi:hypothetical protein
MSWRTHQSNRTGITGEFALAGVLLAGVALLVWWLAQRNQSPALDAARAQVRRGTLATLRAENEQALATYSLIDPTRGTWRLPVGHATELALQFSQNPAAGRSDLLSRLDRATAKPPEKPNPYE